MLWDGGEVADPDGVPLEGHVLDGAGDPLRDAAVETWHPQPPAFARSLTDEDGHWRVTIPPARYVTAHVFARGLLRHLTTRIYLGDPGADPVLDLVPADRRETLIATPSPDGYRFDIRLQGERETAFFDL